MAVLLPPDHERGRAVLAEHLEDLACMINLGSPGYIEARRPFGSVVFPRVNPP